MIALVTRKPTIHSCVNKTQSPLCVYHHDSVHMFMKRLVKQMMTAIHLSLASAKRKMIKHEPGRAQGIRLLFIKGYQVIMENMGLVPSSWLDSWHTPKCGGLLLACP